MIPDNCMKKEVTKCAYVTLSNPNRRAPSPTALNADLKVVPRIPLSSWENK